jgi:hypothetical protein
LVFKFIGELDARLNPAMAEGTLDEIVVTCDGFCTQRRRPEGQVLQRRPRLNGHPLAADGVRGGKVVLDDGKAAEFGMSIGEAEQIFGPAKDDPLVDLIGRKGIDREIVAAGAKLKFDRGRLKAVDFTEVHRFLQPVRVFDEGWKNPDPIAGFAVMRGITRGEFDSYLTAWKKRAEEAGKKPDVDYNVSVTNETLFQMVSLSLAPHRLTPNGRGVWADGWSVTFKSVDEGSGLGELHVLLDMYNSSARPEPGEGDPTLTGVTLEDGTELYFGQSLDEVEQLTGASAAFGAVAGPASRSASYRVLQLDPYSFRFENGMLSGIGYGRRNETPAPFRQLWKNLTPIGDLTAGVGVTKNDFMVYLEAWRARAADGRLEHGRHYTIREDKTERFESVVISMYSDRVSQTGLRTSDMWVVNLSPPGRANQRVSRIDAICGEFTARQLSPAAQRSRSVKEVAKEMPKMELPKLEFPLPFEP